MTRPYLAKSSQPSDSVEFVPTNVRYLYETLAELGVYQTRLREQYALLYTQLNYKQAFNQSVKLQQEQRYCDLEQELAHLKQQIKASRRIYADLLRYQQSAHDAAQNARVNEELSRQNQWLVSRVEELRAECDILVKQDTEKEADYVYQKQDLESRFTTYRTELQKRIAAVYATLDGTEKRNEGLRHEIQIAEQRNAALEAEILYQTSRAKELRGLVMQAAALDLPGKAAALYELVRERRKRTELIRYLGAGLQAGTYGQAADHDGTLLQLADSLHADYLDPMLAALSEALTRFMVVEAEIQRATDAVYSPSVDACYAGISGLPEADYSDQFALYGGGRLKDVVDAEYELEYQLGEQRTRLLVANQRLEQYTALAAGVAERETELSMELAQSQAEAARASSEQLQAALAAYQTENAVLEAQIAEMKARIAAKSQ